MGDRYKVAGSADPNFGDLLPNAFFVHLGLQKREERGTAIAGAASVAPIVAKMADLDHAIY